MDSSRSSRTRSVRLMTKNLIARSSLVFCAPPIHSDSAQNSDGDRLSDADEMTLGTNSSVASFSARPLGSFCLLMGIQGRTSPCFWGVREKNAAPPSRQPFTVLSEHF